MKQSTFAEMKNDFGTYPYTCKKVDSTEQCQVLLKVISLTAERNIKVQYYSYSSTSLDGTRTNEVSSNAKTQLDNWYKVNMVGKMDDDNKSLIDYIVDATFCNDRSITDKTYNSGYKLNQNTFYSSYTRLYASANKTATLKCSNDIRDKFSVTSGYGNAKLTYPIGLITIDEVALSGGKYNTKNENYYLHTNGYYWTMTPLSFLSSYIYVYGSYVSPTGFFNRNTVNSSFGLRPVINIRGDVLISSGDGTVDSPYRLTLS